MFVCFNVTDICKTIIIYWSVIEARYRCYYWTAIFSIFITYAGSFQMPQYV